MLLAAAAAVAALAGPPPLKLARCSVQRVAARCGTLLVPENRARPGGRRIGLNVVVVPARHRPAAPDAFAVLAGGPGGAATEQAYAALSTFSRVAETRDVLLVDQRGTGSSNPLACLAPKQQISTPKQARAFVRACLQGQPGDMRRYGTRDAMDDLDAARAALGYRTLDVYGASYGATAAQVYLKRHPRSVRTLILDGATELDVPFYGRLARNAQHALDDLARRCAADRACAKAFPGWRATFTRLVRGWNAHPVLNRKGEHTTGAGLASTVEQMLLDANSAAAVPLFVTRAAAGDYRLLNERLDAGSGSPQLLMYYSIWCNEPWVGLGAKGPWHTDFDTQAAEAVSYYRTLCSFLPARAEPASAWTLPRSQVPVLALAGGADPQDPITNLPRLKQAFPNSRALVVPHYGHTVAQYGCLGGVVGSFVEHGTARGLDARCAAALAPPPFTLR